MTHSSIVTKPLALGLSLLCSGEGSPCLGRRSEGSPAGLISPKFRKRAEQRTRARDRYARKMPGPLFNGPQ